MAIGRPGSNPELPVAQWSGREALQARPTLGPGSGGICGLDDEARAALTDGRPRLMPVRRFEDESLHRVEPNMPSRRLLVTRLGALPLVALAARFIPSAHAAGGLEDRFGPPAPFDFEQLRVRASELAAAPYQATPVRHADVLESIDFDVYQKIRYRPEMTLWSEGAAFPVRFFHLGRYFKQPVGIYVVEEGVARQILYAPDFFDFGSTGMDEKLPDDIGFAGFKVMDAGGVETDWLAFLGAAYFRSSGELDQYGLSARGIAIDVAMPWPEEFPRFTDFWLEPGAPGSNRIRIYTLMDGPSVAGAYRIDCINDGGVVMDVQADLFPRKDIARMGVAPITSMFWYAEHNRHLARDWRPEIHDSDGLAMWTGSGERIWRPLNNPGRVQTSSFLDQAPKGFGLLQRDRAFANYEDDGVFYDRRPSLWVEPLGDWGRGVVQLVEIPTDDEIHDNIAAYWVPEAPVKAGSDWSFSYRLHWLAKEPYLSTTVGRVQHTRLGRGGVPGQPRPDGARKFVVDFAGGPLHEMTKESGIEPVINASRGEIDGSYVLPVVGTERWRVVFDLYAEGAEPVELRCFLRADDRTLTETWLYQYIPFSYGDPHAPPG